MLTPAPHPAEAFRLETVHDLGLLDSWTEECFDRVVRLAKRHFDVPVCAFSVVDRSRQVFKAREGLELSETARDFSFCAHAILDDAILEVPDALKDERFADSPMVTGAPHVRFYAGAPVRAPNGLPVGSLCIIDTKPRTLTPEQRTALRDFADIMQDELVLRSDAIRDHLTRLYNRRFADEYLEREMRRAFRVRLPLTILIIDVDHFKAYNDLFGHLRGDEALCQIARQIDACCRRPGDFVARFGGEEFIAILPSTDYGGAQTLAEYIRREIAALPIKHPKGKDGHFTVSIGGIICSDLRQLEGGRVALVEAADELLYQAKQNGRDQAVLNHLGA
jgi:diguanylate cyclase (GGDEF)-like protein